MNKKSSEDYANEIRQALKAISKIPRGELAKFVRKYPSATYRIAPHLYEDLGYDELGLGAAALAQALDWHEIDGVANFFSACATCQALQWNTFRVDVLALLERIQRREMTRNFAPLTEVDYMESILTVFYFVRINDLEFYEELKPRLGDFLKAKTVETALPFLERADLNGFREMLSDLEP